MSLNPRRTSVNTNALHFVPTITVPRLASDYHREAGKWNSRDGFMLDPLLKNGFSTCQCGVVYNSWNTGWEYAGRFCCSEKCCKTYGPGPFANATQRY